MSAILTATGVTFSDSTSLNSKYAVVEQGAAMVFSKQQLRLDGLKRTHIMIKHYDLLMVLVVDLDLVVLLEREV